MDWIPLTSDKGIIWYMPLTEITIKDEDMPWELKPEE